MAKVPNGTAHNVVIASDSFFANMTAILGEVFKSPGSDSVITVIEPAEEPPFVPGRIDFQVTKPPKVKRQNPVGSHFKLIFLTTVALTLILLIADIILPTMWLTPTPPQHDAIMTVDTLLKAGFGAIIGLLGGKVAK
jgi:hypothetical protein